MEPLESTAIHLIQRSVLRFIRMLPAGRVSARDIAEYNDQQELDAAQIRDFLILHYKVTNRRDSPFWRHCADMPIPDSLDQKMQLFPATGRVFRRNDDRTGVAKGKGVAEREDCEGGRSIKNTTSE